MKSKLITVGDEILIGQVVNTNAAFIGDKMFSIGMPVVKSVVVGDDEKYLYGEFEESLKNFDITLITGGLGPTHDDITKPVLVDFFKDELVLDKKVLEHVKNFFITRNIYMPETNIGQAMIPSKSKVVWNANGTAPGIWMEKDNKVFIAMPGVPFEMKEMVNNFVIPELKKKYSSFQSEVFKQKTLLTTGLGESTLHEKIGDLSEILRDSKLAFLPSAEGVRLRINTSGKNDDDAGNRLIEIEKSIREKVGDHVFGINEETLEEIIVNILRSRSQTLSVAESCTGGRICSRIVSIPGSSECFIGGVVAYSNKEKVSMLKVREETIKKYGAVSMQTAIEMAEGIRKEMGTDFALSVTGIAGPGGGTAEKPVGLVWIGFSGNGKCYAMDFLFGNNREYNILRATQRALEILRRELLNIEIKF